MLASLVIFHIVCVIIVLVIYMQEPATKMTRKQAVWKFLKALLPFFVQRKLWQEYRKFDWNKEIDF